MNRLFLYFLIACFFSFSAYAEDNQSYISNQSLEERYSSSSLAKLEEESEQGDGVASYLAAFAYTNGDKSTRKNDEESVEYFKKSYNQGFLQSGYYLGAMYFSGSGVNKDIEEGLGYLTSAADAGYPKAVKKLAEFYLFARVDPSFQSDEKALYWLKKAAATGDGNAIYNLSIFYLNGRGGAEKNERTAFSWMMRAAEQDYMTSYSKVGDFYAQGIGTEQDLVRAYMMYDLGGTASSGKKAELAEQMTQAQIDEAVSLSRQWQEEHNSYRPSYHGLEAQGSDGHYEYH
ncbi:tetratricopeptide repeat protein [Salinicola aestuarinus]|uniref:tetratricopeptide repeat protein n=1 Tax=Salinicola aestuarinus TaxID=1949082 RepID=UPI000DA1DC60|nr:tetratricopeptide repeat protein [Salinicola aestuarinus]